jgi:hypothetical protein
MKQLLFLLLFPCLALAQYTGNAGQKITLGEQTTADGLVWRGRLADTANLLTNKLDTSVYIVLDTGTRAMWYYRASTTPKWTRLVDSLNNLQGQLSLTTKVTGVLPVANGGTNTSTAFTQGSVLFAGASGTYAQDNTNFFWNNTTKRLGIGTINPFSSLDVRGNIVSLREDNYTVFAGSNYSNTSVHGVYFEGNRARGTLASPTAVNSGDIAFALTAQMRGNSGYVQNATIFMEADGSYSGNDVPSRIRFLTRETNATLERMRITSTGNVGIGQTSPTAVLHLKAGTATASTAPLKFTSGVNLTSPLGGEMEFNGTNLFFSPSTTRHTVNHGLTGSVTLNFPSTTTLLSADLTITVTGAADGDVVSLGVPNAAVNANTCYTAWVSAANTVTVRFNNYSSGTVDPASALFKVFVTK